MHTLWVVYGKGCWLVVTRAFLGLPIRFYCGDMKNSSFLQKWYSKSSKNCFQFWYFWETEWWRFRLRKFFRQVAQNQVKVATDGSFCADTTFVQTPLKIFLFTLRLRSRYLKGTPELALYPGKKIGTIGCTDRIILKENWKWRIRWSQKWSKNWAGNVW